MDIKEELQAELDEAKKELEGFKKFAFKDSMFKLAVAFIIGTAFQNVVKAIASNILMPIINYFLIKTGSDWRHWKIIPEPGMELEIGQFIGVFIDFLITAVILYLIYKKIMRIKDRDEAA